MKKSLILTLWLSEELPTPLSCRLQIGSQSLPLSFRKGEEVPCDQPLRMDFYYAGELIGSLRLLPGEVSEKESKWLPLSFAEKELSWAETGDGEVEGPRVMATLEPLRPLSPIMEMTEASECSMLDPQSRLDSSSEDLRTVLSDLQHERDVTLSKQKDLQLKVMELQQALVKERWKAKMDLEQTDQRHKAEIGHLSIIIEKMKAAIKRDAAAAELLKAKASDLEGKLTESETALRFEREKAAKQAEIHAGLLATIQSLEGQLTAATHLSVQLQSQLTESQNRCESLNSELVSSAYQHGGESGQREMDLKPTTPPRDVLDLKQSIASLQNALAASHVEMDLKDKELRQMYEGQRAKSVNMEGSVSKTPRALRGEMSISVGDCTVPDLVDDLLREYAQMKKVTVPMIRISEGQYSIGSKRVSITVRNGVLVIRVGGGFMHLDEYLKLYTPSDSTLSTPRRSLLPATRKPQSLGPEQLRHHRSVTTALELISSKCDWQSQRIDTDSGIDCGIERGIMKIANRDMSPKPVYWRETVSSHNKVTKKGDKVKGERGRVKGVKAG